MSGTTSYIPLSTPAVLEPVPLPTGASAQDVTFLQAAWQSNAAEIVSAALAGAKAADPQTKQFANWMNTDHGGVAGTLTTLAADLGVTLPNSFTPEQSSQFNQLQALPGVAFDQNFAAEEILDHQQTLALFEQEAANGTNPAVVAFAQQLIPVLQAHLFGASTLFTSTTGVSLNVAAPPSPTPLSSSGPPVGITNAQDAAFVQTAALANMAEVAQGQLAEGKTGNPAGTQFAQWMVADHSGAQASLQTLAGQEGLTLPSGLDAANQQQITTLQGLNGESFFAPYVTAQILGHTKSLTAFIQEAEHGEDPAIRTYAQTGISVLTGHLAGALNLAQTTPGAEAAAPIIDSALTNLLNNAAATGDTELLNDLTQVAKIQPGFAYTPPKATLAAGGSELPSSATAMPLIAMSH